MPTISITKKFVIKDDIVCKRLVDALEATPVEKQEYKSCPSSYERGKELLLMRYGRHRKTLKWSSCFNMFFSFVTVPIHHILIPALQKEMSVLLKVPEAVLHS